MNIHSNIRKRPEEPWFTGEINGGCELSTRVPLLLSSAPPKWHVSGSTSSYLPIDLYTNTHSNIRKRLAEPWFTCEIDGGLNCPPGFHYYCGLPHPNGMFLDALQPIYQSVYLSIYIYDPHLEEYSLNKTINQGPETLNGRKLSQLKRRRIYIKNIFLSKVIPANPPFPRNL